VIKDVPKTWVFEICRDLNRRAGREIVPQTVIDKPPSAELRPDQFDTDSLPPYDILDRVLEAYIEEDRTAGEVVELCAADGIDPDVVRRVVRLVDVAEYKRRQAPPGVRVTTKAFGKDRRLPITNGYRG
jgi:NAD+ synthase (glutamine-hydrolysing)